VGRAFAEQTAGGRQSGKAAVCGLSGEFVIVWQMAHNWQRPQPRLLRTS
jgi:hypothetical protein